MSAIKVYGTTKFVQGKQVRAIIAGNNPFSLAQAAGVSVKEFKKKWTESRNDTEIAVATASPLCVFVSPLYEKSFVKLEDLAEPNEQALVAVQQLQLLNQELETLLDVFGGDTASTDKDLMELAKMGLVESISKMDGRYAAKVTPRGYKLLRDRLIAAN